MQLRAYNGRAVLAADRNGVVATGQPGVDPHGLVLGDELADSLHEWAHVAEAVSQRGQPPDGAAARLVSRRGRQLAGRVAAATGVPVTYVDPVTGEVSEVTVVVTGSAAARPPAPPTEPTPWATGLTVTAFTAVVVVVAVLALSRAMADVSPWLAVAANLAIAAGLAPSVWATRRVPVWRWVSLGVVVGLAVSWIAALLAPR